MGVFECKSKKKPMQVDSQTEPISWGLVARCNRKDLSRQDMLLLVDLKRPAGSLAAGVQQKQGQPAPAPAPGGKLAGVVQPAPQWSLLPRRAQIDAKILIAAFICFQAYRYLCGLVQ